MDHLAQAHEQEVVVVTMRAYDVVMGLPWITTRQAEIDWATSPSPAFRTPSGQGEEHRSGMMGEWYEGRNEASTNIRLPNRSGSMPTINSMSGIPVDQH
jgi:hypothetical protein